MNDSEYQSAFEQIAFVLSFYWDDYTFCPPRQDKLQELNPTNDHIKIHILRLDRIVNWRHKIWRATRQQDDLYPWELPWRRKYMTCSECHAFWGYYWDGRPWNWETKQAISKVYRLMARVGLLD